MGVYRSIMKHRIDERADRSALAAEHNRVIELFARSPSLQRIASAKVAEKRAVIDMIYCASLDPEVWRAVCGPDKVLDIERLLGELWILIVLAGQSAGYDASMGYITPKAAITALA